MFGKWGKQYSHIALILRKCLKYLQILTKDEGNLKKGRKSESNDGSEDCVDNIIRRECNCHTEADWHEEQNEECKSPSIPAIKFIF